MMIMIMMGMMTSTKMTMMMRTATPTATTPAAAMNYRTIMSGSSRRSRSSCSSRSMLLLPSSSLPLPSQQQQQQRHCRIIPWMIDNHLCNHHHHSMNHSRLLSLSSTSSDHTNTNTTTNDNDDSNDNDSMADEYSSSKTSSTNDNDNNNNYNIDTEEEHYQTCIIDPNMILDGNNNNQIPQLEFYPSSFNNNNNNNNHNHNHNNHNNNWKGPIQLRYRTYGAPPITTATQSNVIVICHALTGNVNVHTWWEQVVSDLLQQQNNYHIICFNGLGSCYGSTSPISPIPTNTTTSTTGSTMVDDHSHTNTTTTTTTMTTATTTTTTTTNSSSSDPEVPPSSSTPSSSSSSSLLPPSVYGIDFPNVTVQDNVRYQLYCCQHILQYQSIHCVIGGSFGGMLTLEYALCGNTTNTNKTNYIHSIIPIACNAQHNAWQIAISEIQRQMIYQNHTNTNTNNSEQSWYLPHNKEKAIRGLQLARQMAMITYRTPLGYQTKFGRRLQQSSPPQTSSLPPPTTTNADNNETTTTNTTTLSSQIQPSQEQEEIQLPQWEVANYLQYQGTKFITERQFDPITYVKLTQQMDTHDICRNRIIPSTTTSSTNLSNANNEENVKQVLSQITIPTLVMGIDSDLLYPLHEQRDVLHKYIPNSQFRIIHSLYGGHDGFLLEQQQVSTYITEFLQSLRDSSSSLSSQVNTDDTNDEHEPK